LKSKVLDKIENNLFPSLLRFSNPVFCHISKPVQSNKAQNMTTPFDKYKNAWQCASDVAELLVDGHKRVSLENLNIAVNALRKKQYTVPAKFRQMLKTAEKEDTMRQYPYVNRACFKIIGTGSAMSAMFYHEKSVPSKQKPSCDREVQAHWIVAAIRKKYADQLMDDEPAPADDVESAVDAVPATAEVVVDDVIMDDDGDKDDEDAWKGFHSDKHAEESRQEVADMWSRKPDIDVDPDEAATHSSRFNGDAANIAHQIRAYLFPKKEGLGSRKGVSAYRDAYSVEHVQMHKQVTDFLDEGHDYRHLGRGITVEIQRSAKIIHEVLKTNLKDDFKVEQIAEILNALQTCMW
jgi:hypothetical protein